MSARGPVIGLAVEVPIACFRVPYAREYFETYRVPPPSTVYGMLLSYVGEPWRANHAGAEIALAITSEPAVSTVLRKVRRMRARELTDRRNSRPDFQELLVDVCLAVWVRPGRREGLEGEPAPRALAERVEEALRQPASVERFGGLSLGESTHVVNEVRALREGEVVKGRLLLPSLEGPLTLPVWPDHVGSRGTRWGRYELVPFEGARPPDDAWEVCAPAGGLA